MAVLSAFSSRCTALLDAISDYGIVLLDARGRIEFWNTGATRLFGHTADEAAGRPIDLIFTAPDCARSVPRDELEEAGQTGIASDSRWHCRKDGSLLWIDGSVTAVHDDRGELSGFVKIMHDGSERKRYEAEIIRLARVDPLTGLANRFAFTERIGPAAESAGRRGQRLIVQLIDLDGFKDVNDRFGHGVGDRVLAEVATRLATAVRKSDLLARVGGDEFFILQSDIDDPRDGERVAQAVVDALAQPITVEHDEQVTLGASVGLAVYPDDATDLDRLVRIADTAMYAVKQRGGNGYHFATRGMDDAAHRRSCDRARLKRAVSQRLLAVHYQPQVDAASGRVVAIEALVRFEDPALGHLSVDELLALARSAGLMRAIGAFVLEEACAQARAWQDAGFEPVRMCVNMCADEASDPALQDRVDAVLTRTGLAPQWLEIELTERQMFEYTRQGHDALEGLRHRGITLAIDDFGTGYSALSYLLRMPVDRIKLDRSFVQHVTDDPQSAALARAVVALAHIMALPVVIEGIETPAQADFFRAEGCETLQGYLFGRPAPAAHSSAGWQHARHGASAAAHAGAMSGPPPR